MFSAVSASKRGDLEITTNSGFTLLCSCINRKTPSKTVFTTPLTDNALSSTKRGDFAPDNTFPLTFPNVGLPLAATTTIFPAVERLGRGSIAWQVADGKSFAALGMV